MSRANEENNELDDLFMKADDADGSGDNFFASLNGSSDASSPFGDFEGDAPLDASPSPFDDLSDSGSSSNDAFGDFSDGFSESESIEALPGEQIDAFEAAPFEADAPAVGKGKGKGKGQKAKAPKAKKEKAPKAPKEKKAKAPKSDVRYGSAKPFVALGALFLLGILAANAFAFMNADAFKAAETNLIVYLIVFDVLGALLLAVPAMLINQLKTRAVSLFDLLLALVAAFITMAAMTFLAYQAKTYGFPPSKVASNVAVSTFDDRA